MIYTASKEESIATNWRHPTNYTASEEESIVNWRHPMNYTTSEKESIVNWRHPMNYAISEKKSIVMQSGAVDTLWFTLWVRRSLLQSKDTLWTTLQVFCEAVRHPMNHTVYTVSEKESIAKWRHRFHLNFPLSNFFQLCFAMMIKKFQGRSMVWIFAIWFLLMANFMAIYFCWYYLQLQQKSLSRSNYWLIVFFLLIFECLKFYLRNLFIEIKPGSRGQSPQQAEDP
jgi:hypothetical protein